MFLFVFQLWLVFWVDEWEGKKEGYTSYRTCSINTLFYLFNLDCPITRSILRIIFDQCNTREKEVGKQALISVWWSQFALCNMKTKMHLVLCQCCVGTSVLPRESGSTVTGSVKHSIPITLARKKGTPVRMENCANLSISLPNLDSLPQHCGALSWLLGDSDSAYFNKNTYNFLAIQTFICMQGIALASAVGQWCWASAQDELWWNLNAFNGTQSSRRHHDSDCVLVCKHMQKWEGTFHFILLCFFNSCTHRQQECLRLAHCCAHLLSVGLLVKKGALKNFTQKCVKFNYS